MRIIARRITSAAEPWIGAFIAARCAKAARGPLAEMFGYSTDLRSRTQGRATYTMQFSEYMEKGSGGLTIENESDGLFISIEMIKEGGTKEPDAALTMLLSDRLKDKGFLVSYSGKFNNVLKIRPPLVFSHADAEEFLRAFDECMGEMGE